jgi:hypothetical protein
MVRVLTQQASHTYGVLDPLVIERRDTKFLAASLADARNVIMLPQGGYVDRGGSTRKTLLRRKLAAVTVSAAMISAPNGGTAANLSDGNAATLFTTAAVAGDPFVVASIDFGAPMLLCAVDLFDAVAGTAGRDDCLAVQWLDGATWRNITDAFRLDLAARTRRFAVAPAAANITARQLRVIVSGGAGPGTVSLSGLRVFTETTTISDAVVRGFNYEPTISYQLVVSENNLDVFKDGVWQAAVPLDVTETQVRALKRETDYATVLLFGQFLATREMQRQGSDREWNIRPAPFKNIPRSDYGATYVNGVNEVQRLRFFSMTTADAFQLIFNGAKTAEIAIGGSWATAAVNVKAALEAMPGVAPGLTVTSPAAAQIDVSFTGGDNAGRNWLQMEALVLQSSHYISITTVSEGKAPGEDLFSALRGYPAVGRFSQERLVAGGITQSPSTLVASVTGEVYNFNTELGGAAAATSFDIAGEQNAIREIFASTTTLIFTDNSVWHLRSAVLSAEDVPELRRSDAPGIDPNLPALSLANAIFYVQRGGQTIMKLNFSALEENFVPDNASVLSASLVRRPIDWTLRRSTEGNDSDLLFYINDDGSLVSLTLMQAQEISGFAPHVTDGKYVSLCVDGDQNVWQICERDVAGATRMILERMDPDLQLDSAIEFSFEVPSSALLNLDDYEGKSVWAVADGKVQGPFAVIAGGITLAAPATAVRLGLWIPPLATDTPFQPEEEQQRPMARNKRVFGIDVSVVDTTSLAIAANGNAAVPLVLNEPKTGVIETEGWPGFTRTAQVTLTQTRPGRLLVRSVKKRISA